MMRARFIVMALLFIVAPGAAWGEVGDPTIQTDHSYYAGEGAFQTVEDCVRFATQHQEGVQERAIGLYLWLLTHQYHLASPQEPYVPGLTPDTNRPHDDLTVFDANRARFSYSYGLCGTVHAWNEVYWRALGMPARRRAFPGHTNSEIFYENGWRAFDTDMAGLLFREDGLVAGYDDIRKNPRLATSAKPPLPCYPFAWPSDFQVMKNGWEQIARGGEWPVMYNSGYAALPGVVHLRSGESFTRWFNRDHWGGVAKRRFWHHAPGGPFRDWTFVNCGTPEHRNAESNSRGNASYCNGEFLYRPDLSRNAYREGIAAKSANVEQRAQSPRLFSSDGAEAFVTFSHFSPYVICGDPVDDANPMSAPATDGVVVTGIVVGDVTLDYSADGGQTWKTAGVVSGSLRYDLTEAFKGRYGWLIRFRWKGSAGLDEVAFATTTQVSQTIYPRLKPGGCNVVYRCASRGVAHVRPNFALPEEQLADVEVQRLRSANVEYIGRSHESRLAYRVRDNRPGQIVFRVAAPSLLTEISAAARFSVRSPAPPSCDFHLDVSTDQGRSWRTFSKAEVPSDNEYSSGWVYGKAEITDASTREALVRVHLYAGGYATGLIDAEFFGVHKTSPPQQLELTYGWRDGDRSITHRETIPAGAEKHAFYVATGEDLRDEFVRLVAP